MTTRRFFLMRGALAWLAVTAFFFFAMAPGVAAAARPNILVLMADDWSWPHAGTLGDTTVNTPAFDRLVREGVLFENAFVSSPSCTPSRFAIATGQYHWRLGDAANLGGSLAKGTPVYPELLEAAGYTIGFSRKGAAPSKHEHTRRDPFGARHKNFEAFMNALKAGTPFCFWYGAGEPHRPYPLGEGAKRGINPASIKVPASLPDHETVRSDMADYYLKVQRFDTDCGRMIERLRESGELDNTIVVISGDNGMPFPRSKATLYDTGTRVPLAIRWGARIKRGRRVADFTSLCDLAPTFLEAAGLTPPAQMTGRSLMAALDAKRSGQLDASRDFVLTGMERHVYPWPARAIRTADFLYIRNYDAKSWPTGVVKGHNPNYDFAKTPWPTERGAFSWNIDPSPTKQLLRKQQNNPEIAPFAKRVFSQRPAEELYDLRKDAAQLRNVAKQREYAAQRLALSRRMDRELAATGDRRIAQPEHELHVMEGWIVHVSKELRRQKPELTKKALELLAGQCREVIRVLPPAALKRVRTVPIWLTLPAPGRRPGAEYHDSAGWLAANKMSVAKAKCVEISNAAILEREIVRMPMLLLHEMAHAYHSQVLGFNHAEIKAAYERARDNGSYVKVARKNHKPQKAYGMNNHKEYFAETTEAFFGENDFFPFNRAELEKHDPQMVGVLKKVWGAE